MQSRHAVVAMMLALWTAQDVPLVALCGLEPRETANWVQVTSRYRTFFLRLPPGAAETPIRCIDSPCGVIAVGKSQLIYDGGPMAGSGDSASVREGETVMRRCHLNVGARRMDIAMVRAVSGEIDVRAALPASPTASSLYLNMQNTTPAEREVFFTALQTLRMQNREVKTPRGRQP